jgi:hypothetical protein
LPATIKPNSNSLISALSGETKWADETMGMAGCLLAALEAGAAVGAGEAAVLDLRGMASALQR